MSGADAGMEPEGGAHRPSSGSGSGDAPPSAPSPSPEEGAAPGAAEPPPAGADWRVPWSLADAASFIMFDAGLMGLAVWLSAALGAQSHLRLTMSLARLLVFLPLALLVAVKLWGVRLRDVGVALPSPGSFRWLLGFTAAVLAFYAVLGLAGVAWLVCEGDAALVQRLGAQSRGMLGANGGVPAFALAALVAAPLAEELAFRGVLYPALRARLAAPWAVLVSALVFALMHLFWGWRVYLPLTQFLGGLIFAILYEKTRSILWPAVFHVAGNLFIVANAWAWARHPAWIARLLGLAS